MRTVVRPLFFDEKQEPIDKELYGLAVEFCSRELAEPIELLKYRNILVVCKEDKAGNVLKVTGIGCGALRYEISVLRFLDSKSGHALTDRFNTILLDQGVPKGTEILAFVDVNEKAEQRCLAADDWMASWEVKPSNRVIVRVR